MVAGPSQCGKTTFVSFEQMILHSNALISPPPQVIVWNYSDNQPTYDRLTSRVVFKKGLSLVADIRAYSNILLVLDDLMSDMVSLSSGLFTKHVHHQNLSISYNVQNIFNNAKSHRTLSLNANYIVLFKNP